MKKVLIFAFLFCLPASAEEFSGKVVSVHDGDTARVEKPDGTVVNIRFIYCDAPEIDQPHGIQSRDFVRGMIDDKQVTVRSEGTDDYGRVLGEITIDGTSVNKEVIREGHGWWFYHYHEEPELGDLEVEARSQKKGLWAAESPIYPRAWRRGARLDGSGASGGDGGSGGTPSTDQSIFIMALMPNPMGQDENNETVTLANSTDVDVSIDQWRLEDDDNGVFTLSGTVPAGGATAVRLNSSLQLGNSGDTVRLRKPSGEVVQTIGYSSASSGRFVLAD